MVRTQSRRDKAVILLAQGTSITDVSDEIGVSRQAIYNWLSDEDYQREIQDEKMLYMRLLSSRMASVCEQALQHLEKVTAGDQSVTLARDADIRLKADRLALTQLRDLYELADHEVRLTRLERGGYGKEGHR